MSSTAWHHDVDHAFGTLEQLDKLTEQLHARDIKLVMDLVVNHISSAHAWFVKSRSSIDKLNARPPSKGPRSGVVSAKGSVPRLYLLCVIWAFRRLRRCNTDLTSAPAASTAPISRRPLSHAASLTGRWEAAYGGNLRPNFQPLTVAAFVQIEVSSLKRVMH